MAVRVSEGIGLEEFLELPERKPALEFEEGRVLQKVSPKGKHSSLQGGLVGYINGLTIPLKMALALPELRTTFGGRSYVPDVSVYQWHRIPVDDRGEIEDDVMIPPDIAIEIRSPRQSRDRLTRRCIWYVDNGVGISLLADPRDHSLVRFLPGQASQLLTGDDRIDLNDVLPGFHLTVRQLFDFLKFA